MLLASAACGARTTLSLEDAPGKPEPVPGPVPVIDAPAPKPDVPGPLIEDENPDVFTDDCTSLGMTSIITISSIGQFRRFNPLDNTFSFIGGIHCPGEDDGLSPFSMTVDRKGTAYVISVDGKLFKVNTTTATCEPTGFIPDQQGFKTFGLTFVTNEGGPEETLYVADSVSHEQSIGLGQIDLSTFKLSFVAPFSKPLGRAVEIAGTGDGHLYGLFIDEQTSKVRAGRIDKKSGEIVGEALLPLSKAPDAFAFAFWGGAFYIFGSEDFAASTVSRYDPKDGSVKVVAESDAVIVGAGPSTCAPTQ